jgi:hypothetical protein
MKNKLVKILLVERSDSTAEKFLNILKEYNCDLNRVNSSKSAIEFISSKNKADVYLVDIGDAGIEGEEIPFMGVSEMRRLSRSSLFFGYSAHDYKKMIRDSNSLQRTVKILSYFEDIFWAGEPFIKENIIPLLQANGYDINLKKG